MLHASNMNLEPSMPVLRRDLTLTKSMQRLWSKQIFEKRGRVGEILIQEPIEVYDNPLMNGSLKIVREGCVDNQRRVVVSRPRNRG